MTITVDGPGRVFEADPGRHRETARQAGWAQLGDQVRFLSSSSSSSHPPQEAEGDDREARDKDQDPGN